MLRIDCHTHIIDPAIRAEYVSRTDGYALVMQFPDSIYPNPHTLETVAGDERLFLCPAVDRKKPIPPQLEAITPLLETCRVVGLKLYLSYQRGTGCDRELYPVYEYAAEHRLSVTFHTGLCSLILPSDGDIAGSDARYIARAAEDFPAVNFILAHMDDPRFTDCIRLTAQHHNLYTDFSGAYETGTKEGGDVAAAIRCFGEAIHSQPEMYRKILYGTDFCPPINLGQLAEYDESIQAIFAPEERPYVYGLNALRAFPRLGDYLCG